MAPRIGLAQGSRFVMAGLDPAIHVLATQQKNVDARAFASPKRLRPRRRDKPGHDDGLDFRAINTPKLFRGHALSDMWDLPGKVAEYCGKSRLDARQTRKLLRDRAEVSCGATALVLG